MSQITSLSTQIAGRILSIQSHVVRGYVGNKAAVFPLQLLGHHVDIINSVQFTSMYIHEGDRLSGEQLRILLDTLPYAQSEHRLANTINDSIRDHPYPTDHQYILTGYVGTSSFLQEIVRFIREQKSLKEKGNLPRMMWICDPVMGDNGKLYVSADVVNVYKNDVISLADILTPNQFELEWLCGETINTLQDAIQCCQILHKKGAKIIIVTSLSLSSVTSDLILLASELSIDAETITQFTIHFPKLNMYLGGTGDLMAAMILDGMDRFNGNLRLTCERAVSILQGVIQYTIQHHNSTDIDVIGGASVITTPVLQYSSKLIPTPPPIND